MASFPGNLLESLQTMGFVERITKPTADPLVLGSGRLEEASQNVEEAGRCSR